MKRELMILKIQEILVEQSDMTLEQAATDMLNRLEKAGMCPPAVRGDLSRAMADIYMFPNFNQWEEEIEKDEEIMEALKRRQEAAQKRKEKFIEASKEVMKTHSNVLKKLKDGGD